MNKLLKPVTNPQTGITHTGLVPTIVGATCFLLVKFRIVPADKLDGEAVSLLVTLIGGLWMLWRTYIKKA